jgi:hypothetical protein
MQDKNLYEYAVIRVVPKVEREEFFNVGIVLFCKNPRFIKTVWKIDEEKLRLFSKELNLEDLKEYLAAFEKIASGDKDGGRIAQMDVPSRFRWLTAVRSSVLQTSRPHPGMCSDLDATLQRLFEDFVT